MQPAFVADREEAAAHVERVLQYTFRDRLLLEEALTHKSSTPDGRGLSYRRLAFIGDSAINLLYSESLYREHHALDPDELTNRRKAYVTNEKFARDAVRHNLYPLLRRGNCPGLDPKVSLFTESVQKEPEGNHGIRAPEVLADIVEAIAGAVYVDSGFNLKVLGKVARRLLGEETFGEYEQKPNEQCSKNTWPKHIFMGILAAIFIRYTLSSIDTTYAHAIAEISFFVGFAGFALFCLRILLWVLQKVYMYLRGHK